MPDKSGKLTSQERVFVKHMASTGDARYAAEKAGYAHPIQRAAQNLSKPAINAEIAARCAAELHNDLRPLANARLRRILEDDDIAPAHHIAAAKVVIAACSASSGHSGDQDVSTMTPAELHAAIARIERQMSQEAVETLELLPSPAKGGGAGPAADVFG